MARICGVKASGDMTQPIRQPVAFPVLEIALMMKVRSAMLLKAAARWCVRLSKRMCS